MIFDFSFGQSNLVHVQRLSVLQISMASQGRIGDSAVTDELHFTDGRRFGDIQRYDHTVRGVLKERAFDTADSLVSPELVDILLEFVGIIETTWPRLHGAK